MYRKQASGHSSWYKRYNLDKRGADTLTSWLGKTPNSMPETGMGGGGGLPQRNVHLKDRVNKYLAIIPRAPMGSESIAHEAEGRMGYWLRGQEDERNNCFSKIQLGGQKYQE